MAGQAGWYRAPGEEGLLRYWNGSVWTEHRQPAPAAEPVTPETVAPVAVTDPGSLWDEPSTSSEPDWSMDQFEKQFAVANDSVLSFDPHLDSDSLSHHDTTTPIAPAVAAPSTVPSFLEPLAPQAAPPTALAATDLAGAALAPSTGSITALQTAPVAPLAPSPSIATSTQASASDHFVSEGKSLVLASKAASEEVDGAAVASDSAREDRNRSLVIGALRGMIAGVLLILVGVGATVFLNMQSTAGAGDIKTVGIVTSLGAKGSACTPVARYAGRGGSFSATTPTSLNPCSVGLGQSVDVVYKLSNPSATGQIVMPNPIQQYLWAAPLIGGLVLIVSLITFIVRAGSIARGVSLIRNGGKRRRRSLQGA